MMVFDLSLGIDFKPRHLILTLLKRSFRRIRLVDYGIYPIPSEDQKEEREAQIISLVNTFISKHQINKGRVSISIPREKAAVRFIKLPIATKENLRKVIEYEVPKYTPFEGREVYFDYQILREDNEQVHLLVIFMRKTEVDPYLSLLKKVGIEPISIQIPTIGALNLFYFNEGATRDEVSVLLDVAEPFFEMNLIQGRDWRESFHLPVPQQKKDLKIMETFKRSGLKEDSFSKSVFYVYGLDADESLLTSFKETDQIKAASFPEPNRNRGGKAILIRSILPLRFVERIGQHSDGC
jgi:Tfp pilus assembly PilM family ATPase